MAKGLHISKSLARTVGMQGAPDARGRGQNCGQNSGHALWGIERMETSTHLYQHSIVQVVHCLQGCPFFFRSSDLGESGDCTV